MKVKIIKHIPNTREAYQFGILLPYCQILSEFI